MTNQNPILRRKGRWRVQQYGEVCAVRYSHPEFGLVDMYVGSEESALAYFEDRKYESPVVLSTWLAWSP